MTSRAEAAAARIREQVPIIQVLQSYGYDVRDDGGHREQQFRCDLHGSGRDNKPSARAYPESNSWYCFACDKTRDAIETVRAKDGVSFWDAVKFLEQSYGLTPLPVDFTERVAKPGAVQQIDQVLDASRTFEEDAAILARNLDICTREHDMSLDQTLWFWEKYDEVLYRVQGPKGEGGAWSADQGRRALRELQTRLLTSRNAT